MLSNSLNLITKRILLPSELSIKVCKERLWKEYQIWILLKAISNGHIRLRGDQIEFLSNYLRMSEKTVRRKIKSLLGLNWIGYNRISKYYFIRSIDSIRIIEKIFKRRAYWFELKYIHDIKGFCAATMITELIISQKRKLSRRWAKKERRHFKPPTYYEISVISLKVIFGLSTRFASVMRKLSTINFTKTKTNIKPFIRNGIHLSCAEKGYIKNNLSSQEINKIRCIKGRLYIQLPNSYQSNLILGKRKNWTKL